MSDIIWTNVRVRLGDLKPWSDNPRLSTKAQARRLLASFDKFGQVQTVAIDPNCEVLDGHQRLSALLTIHGDGFELDARQSSRPLTDAERRELVISLHAGAVGSWDWERVSSWNAGELQGWGMDKDLLKSWNNDANNLKEMLKSEQPSADAEPQTDRAAELLEKWGVKPGDLWQIGEHRLICGDCTDAATVAQVMDGERAELAPVDPPYNVGFEYDGETVDDQKQAEEYEKFTKAWFALCQSVSDRQIVTPGCNNLALWMRWFDAFHWAPWVKRNTQTHGRVTHFWAWEPVLFFGNKWVRRRQLDIYDFPAQFNTQKETANHPCPKPLAMWEDLLKSHSEEGAIILESFSGSGTTLVACENLGRKCRAIEISPAYVAVALERMSTAFPALEIRRVE
jgi:DNA modification methylase